MNRREFIRRAGLTAATTLAAPYILPTGRLFATSPNRVVNHVVFVLFAGGLRQQETIEQRYISTQTGQSATGNIMNNMLAGTAPSQHILHAPWTPILQTPLSNFGTLFREMEYDQSPTGHYNAHSNAMTGQYTETGLNLNVNPAFPTIFEYYRKHSNASAMNAWWLSEGLGPYPSLNYSSHVDYGAKYGANYLRPASLWNNRHYVSSMNYQPDDVARMNKVKDLLDHNFDRAAGTLQGISNTPQERQQIKDLIVNILTSIQNGTLPVPTPNNNYADLTGDLVNIATAWQVLETFKPELMVINTFNSDVCHSNFSNYLTALHRADFGVGWLWNKIQNDPVLANDTLLICMPEHGRNLATNNVFDTNGLGAFDHTGDANSRRIFSLIAGPAGKVRQNVSVGSQGSPIGKAIDIVPTIAHTLGFYNDISTLLPGAPLLQAFV